MMLITKETATNDNDTLTSEFKKANERSIPVEDILQRLHRIPIATAWDIYGKLDRLLKTHPVWRQYDMIIHKALEQREREEESQKKRLYSNVEACVEKPTSTTNIEHLYNNGGTYNDYSNSTISTMSPPLHQNIPKIIKE